MRALLSVLRRVTERREGQDLLEYGLLMALIAIVAISGVTTLGVRIQQTFWSAIANNF